MTLTSPFAKYLFWKLSMLLHKILCTGGQNSGQTLVGFLTTTARNYHGEGFMQGIEETPSCVHISVHIKEYEASFGCIRQIA